MKKQYLLYHNTSDEVIEKCHAHPKLNCFAHQFAPVTWLTYFKRFIFPGPILGLTKIFFAFFFFWIHFLCQHVIFIGYHDYDNPAPVWRRRLSQHCMKFFSRLIMFCAGFYWVKLVDHTKNSNKDPIKYPKFSMYESYPLVGNHLTLLDIISIGQFAGPVSFLAKRELTKVILLGYKLKVQRCIIVDRKTIQEQENLDRYDDDNEGVTRPVSKAQLELTDRITNEPNTLYRPLVFAEGTTGNGKQITRFRKGAFISGKPVRLFTINYISPHCSCAWESVNFMFYLYDMFTQFYLNFEMHVYDLYYPNEDEKDDPDLYAKHCGQFVADELKMPYRHDVDIVYKFLYHDLLRGRITWDEALEHIKKDELRREKLQNERDKVKKERDKEKGIDQSNQPDKEKNE